MEPPFPGLFSLESQFQDLMFRIQQPDGKSIRSQLGLFEDGVYPQSKPFNGEHDK
jgi:hypothetical protein